MAVVGEVLSIVLAVGLVGAAVWRLDIALGVLILASALRDFARVDIGPIHLTQFTIVLTVTLALWLWREIRAHGRAGAPFGPLAWALLLLPIAGMWSLVASVGRLHSLAYTANLAWLAAFALLYARFTADEGYGRRLAAVFVLVALGLAGIAIIQVVFPGLGLGNGNEYWITKTFRTVRPAAFYLDPNFLGGHLAAACVIALGLAADPAERPRRAVWYPTALVLAAVMLLTYSRSAMVALAVGLAALAIALPKGTRRPVVLVLVGLVIASLVATPLVIQRFPGGQLDESSRTRLLMYRSAAEMIVDHPVFGVGLEGFQKVYPRYRDPGALTRVAHPHEVPLALVAETGIAGLVAEVALVAGAVVTFLRRRRLGWDGYDAALLAAFLGLVVGSFFQFYLYFQVWWFVAGLIAAGTGPLRRFAAGPVTSGTNWQLGG